MAVNSSAARRLLSRARPVTGHRSTDAGCGRVVVGGVRGTPGRRGRRQGNDREGGHLRSSRVTDLSVAACDAGAARAAADEPAEIAAEFDAPLLHAVSAAATGAVLLDEGDARAAPEALHRACAGWRELEAPYEYARARVLVGLACRELGDEEAAELEVDAAKQVFQPLGAAPDQARVHALFRTATATSAGGLSGRELQVLALVAKGRTNRQIPAELVLSEHTVRRHLQNIFRKLGVSSRAAATANAPEHELI
jgi:ATP/maltotriose-dependent transcriptional regulator MalT